MIIFSRENAADSASAKTSFSEDKMADKMALQRTSAMLLPQERVAHCIWTQVGNIVSLMLKGADARFDGVQTCGSWSACPVCAARISEVRRQELRLLEEWAGSPANDYRMIMMTLTCRHRRRKLSALIKKMAAAKARMQNVQPWKGLRKDGVIFGSVSVREATHGEKNGWHPHYHVVILVRADSDEEAIEILEPARQAWLRSLRKEGLTGTADRAFHLQNADAVSAYLSEHGRDPIDKAKAKEARPAWGVAEEMTQSRAKKGRGKGPDKSRSPFQILRDAHDGDEASQALWQEYGIVMHGKRQQVWSNGLKELIGIKDKEDEEVAEGEEHTEEEDITCALFDKDDWRTWRPHRAKLLYLARNGGPEAVADFMANPSGDEDEIEVIEDDPKPTYQYDAAQKVMDDLIADIDRLLLPPEGGLAFKALIDVPRRHREASLNSEKDAKLAPAGSDRRCQAASGPSDNVQGSGECQRRPGQAERGRPSSSDCAEYVRTERA